MDPELLRKYGQTPTTAELYQDQARSLMGNDIKGTMDMLYYSIS